MEVRFALVLDENAVLDPVNWRASAVAPTRSALRLEHDGHVLILPRKPADHRVEDVTVVHATTGAETPAGVYELGLV